MRPVRLAMQAFGPYAGRVEVDFRAAIDSGLFGIYGPTGSGKSSVFSAMTFALFGEAARSEQSPRSLRSDHADPALVTEVEFVFALGERHYLIRRQPEQDRPALKGGGEVTQKHIAWVFEVTGLSPDAIASGATGTVLAERKISLVEEQISRILGYGAPQFRQIVLLPQGRFETFLTARTEERKAILRELFDVSVYRSLSEKLKAESVAADAEIRLMRATSRGRLTDTGFETDTALADGLEAAVTNLEASETAFKHASAGALQADAAVKAAEMAAAAFAARDACLETLLALDRRAEEIEALVQRLVPARAAASLADLDAAHAAATVQAKEADRLLADAAVELAGAVAAREKAATRRAVQLADADRRAALDRALDALCRHKETFEKSGSLAVARAAAAERLAKAQAAAAAARMSREAATNAMQALRKEEDLCRATDADRRGLLLRRATLSAAVTAFDRHRFATHSADRARQVLARAQADLAAASTALEAARVTLTAVEAARASTHAQELAADLDDGTPCPVCGSLHHPAPPAGASAAVTGEPDLATARQTLGAALDLETAARSSLASASAILGEREDLVVANALPADLADAEPDRLKAELDAVAAALARLGEQADPDALEARLTSAIAQLAASDTAFEHARSALDAANLVAGRADAAHEAALDSIPDTLRNPSQLHAETVAATSAVSTARAALADAEAADRAASEALVRAEMTCQEAGRRRTVLAAHMSERQADFALRLTRAGLDPARYEAAQPDIALIDAFAATIETHRTDRATARQQVTTAEAAVTGLERPDVDIAMAKRTAANQVRDEALRAAESLRVRRDFLEALLKGLAQDRARIDARERDVAPLRRLAEVFSGQNPAKTQLETYAIAAMFDAVLEASNLRLSRMSGGRYALAREREAKGAGQRGLGIEVDDSHTGRARPTSTLSGGETFLAALALALGLSDIVQEAGRGIRLDTIFIDEGFGSLDGDTLDTVLQALQDLVGSNRSIGLISHVDMVQQAIPNGFRIVSGPKGSRIETRTL